MDGTDEVEPRALGPTHPSAHDLEELVFECLERIEAEGSAALELICREHAADAPALLERVRALLDRGLLDVATPPAPGSGRSSVSVFDEALQLDEPAVRPGLGLGLGPGAGGAPTQ